MSARADEFWDDIEALRKEAETLMSSGWVGEAAGTHAALWTEWVESARKVATTLREDAVLVHQAANAYTNTDVNNANSLTDMPFNLDNL